MHQPKPPRCLRELVARAAEDPGVELDALVEEWENCFFALECSCGGRSFTVRSFIEERAYGPIHLQCAACNRETTCFDPALHGYDVEIDHFPQPAPYRGPFRAFACPECESERFALTARFQYPDNVREDLFSYFTLIGRCNGCNALATIASIECA